MAEGPQRQLWGRERMRRAAGRVGQETLEGVGQGRGPKAVLQGQQKQNSCSPMWVPRVKPGDSAHLWGPYPLYQSSQLRLLVRADGPFNAGP